MDKLIDSKKNIVKAFRQLKDDNIYVNRINYIWKKLGKNNNIFLDSTKIKFIENEFNGNYKEYLEFIIPRITKLNHNLVEIFIPLSEYEEESIDDVEFIDSSSESTESTIEHSSMVQDKDYINLLELNINELQDKIQNISDNLLPTINKTSEIINDFKDKINHQDELIKRVKLDFDEHVEFTKKSINILEDRINKILELMSK